MSTATPRPRRFGWLAVFLGLTMLGGAWGLAAPYGGPPDEREHVVRAAGVAAGQVFGGHTDAALGTGAVQTVPLGLEAAECWQFRTIQTPRCAGPAPDGNPATAATATRAGRYSPVYYLFVGLPLRLWPSWSGLLLARLITAAMVAALLTLALRSAVEFSRHRLVVAGVAVAATPVLFHLAGAVNPAGVEIAAGICLFPALLPLLHGRTPATAAMINRAGVAAVTLAVVRALGPVWLLLAVGVLLVPSSRRRLRELLRYTSMRVWLVAGVLAGAAGVAWTVLLGAAELSRQPVTVTWAGAVKFELLYMWSRYPAQIVGRLSYDNVILPEWWYLAWYMCFGLLVLGALLGGGWVDRWRLAALGAGALLVPTLSDVLGAHTQGFVAQGRYMLPALAGLPIMAAYILGEREVLTAGPARGVVRGLVIVTGAIQFGALGLTMLRWQHGLTENPAHQSVNLFTGVWLPRLGPELPVVLMLLGLATLVGLAVRATPGGPGASLRDELDATAETAPAGWPAG